jgi:phosphoribosylformylglycinamidine synthase
MANNVRRIFVEKKKGFDVEAGSLYRDLKYNLGIGGLNSVRIINRYDIEGISDEEFENSKRTIFSEPPVDEVFDEKIEISAGSRVIAIEYLPGQYDQRADSASQCVQILTHGERPNTKVAKLVVLTGQISDSEYEKAKSYLINPVESHEASMAKPASLDVEVTIPADVKVLTGFIGKSAEEIKNFWNEMGLAMSVEDLEFCQKYFRDTEKRDPTFTEIRVIDTYWSDHCRHTTFLTNIESVEIEDGVFSAPIKKAYESYLESRKYVYGDRQKEPR